jgi:hypothetical protein
MGTAVTTVSRYKVATERRLEAIPPQSILSDGSEVGRFAVPDASLFKVKQLVKVFSDVDSPAIFQVKLVIPGFIYLGAQKTAIDRYSDLSQYTTANNTKVSAEEQERPPIIPDAYNRAMYEEEPVVAKRSILVDKYGRKIDSNNPLPTTATISGDVTIGTNGYDLNDPDSLNVTGSEDGTKTGIKHSLKIGSDLKLEVKDTTAQTILSFISNQLANDTIKVEDDQAQTALNNILTQLASGSLSIGTEDGTPTGVQHVFVNNLKSMILASQDRSRDVNYLDINNRKNRRVDKFEYTSASFPGITLVRHFNYSLIGTEYVFINDNWTLT